MKNHWEHSKPVNPLEDVEKTKKVCRKPQRPTFVFPKWVLQQYGITEEEAKKEFSENIIFL